MGQAAYILKQTVGCLPAGTQLVPSRIIPAGELIDVTHQNGRIYGFVQVPSIFVMNANYVALIDIRKTFPLFSTVEQIDQFMQELDTYGQ